MLDFVPPLPSDVDSVRQAVRRNLLTENRGNERSGAALFLWRRKYRTTVFFRDGVLFRHYGGPTRVLGYGFPIGCRSRAEIASSIDAIEEDAAERGRPFRFTLLTSEEKGILESLRPGAFRFTSDPGDADYLYRRETIASLSGRKFHRKRNYVTRFEKDYPRWRFEPITPSNREDVLRVAKRWLDARLDVGDDGTRLSAPENFSELDSEWSALQTSLHYFKPLRLSGGILYGEETPIGMAIASPITDETWTIHFEKGDPSVPNLYPILARETARILNGAVYLNREEDLNDPGLNQAKRSWFPILQLEKFSGVPVSKRDDSGHSLCFCSGRCSSPFFE